MLSPRVTRILARATHRHESIYVSSELSEEELKDYCFDDMKNVSKIAVTGRFIADLFVNNV